jgi:hypothetical protein
MREKSSGKNTQVKILYITTPIYDFLTATIVEGLNKLAEEMPIQLVTTAFSNYAKMSQVWRRSRIYQERRTFDLTILGTNIGTDVELFWDIARRERSICIDGSDSPIFSYSPSEFALYFKRELYQPASDNIRPCPFAIEQRWLSPVKSNFRYFLAACFGPSTSERARTLVYLKELNWPNIKFGEIPMRKWESLRGVLRRQCSFSTWRAYRFAVGHNHRYYRILRSSLAALSIPGAGIDTGRRWEILGSGALLASPKNNLQLPHPLIPNEHFLEYSSFDELHEKLEWAKSERKLIDAMRMRAREHCLDYHTTEKRARYVLQQFDECRS